MRAVAKSCIPRRIGVWLCFIEVTDFACNCQCTRAMSRGDLAQPSLNLAVKVLYNQRLGQTRTSDSLCRALVTGHSPGSLVKELIFHDGPLTHTS